MILLVALIQVGMFFVGLEVPLNRLVILWGKSFTERQAIIWPAGRALAQVAGQLPLDAKVYLVDPQSQYWWVQAQAIYYFYPRYLTISMANQCYRSDAELATWNEYPDETWLDTHGFTHVMSFKNGIHLRPVTHQKQLPNATP